MRYRSTVDRFLFLVGLAVAIAPPATLAAPAKNAVYAFAQQKTYSLPLTASGNATLVGDTFNGISLRLTTAAESGNFSGEFAVNGGIDVKQSFISNGSVPKPVENLAQNTPYSAPSNEIVPHQAIATALHGRNLDGLDSRGNPVLSHCCVGNDPSLARLLSSPTVGSTTFDFHTVNSNNLFARSSRVDFQTELLPVGDCACAIAGTTKAYVSAVPEISSRALLITAGVWAAAVSGCLHRSRRQVS
jgi:hypothetical protein